ncbi:glycoside hydrolase superfamily [Pyronema domesticum]|uniref:Similar to Chitinase 2 acc. no. P29027 n=1 Tax=Pyronema omphalodes (strain CBS 100304) TaxID=1076935 RepID=U4LQU1_PYROM|nr:glycoside hydrolase superfamily [Pyronema domesticum]CCX31705.1 Similar to Chitinase 2; acc. no. P29027 [Pyronema omphalodes CBS 100304]
MRFSIFFLLASVMTALAVPVANVKRYTGQTVAYFGQIKKSSGDSLANLCKDPNVDIVVLAFLHILWGAGGLPGTDFWPYCSGTIPGTDLANCPTYEADIKACQANGKKVLLSIGGATMTQSMTDPVKFSQNVWNLFGRGKGSIRPFGTAVVDGYDLDIETNNNTGWTQLVAEFRKLAASSGGVIISGAPQCPKPDASLQDTVYKLDYLFIQFYNNWCGTTSIPSSFADWSQDLAAKNPGAKLFVGVPGAADAAGSGYMQPSQMASMVSQVKNKSNYGGVMTWDWAYAKNNIGSDGRNYMQALRQAA